jgi:hypothetical protein
MVQKLPLPSFLSAWYLGRKEGRWMDGGRKEEYQGRRREEGRNEGRISRTEGRKEGRAPRKNIKGGRKGEYHGRKEGYHGRKEGRKEGTYASIGLAGAAAVSWDLWGAAASRVAIAFSYAFAASSRV